jgi:hypothetical protein
LPESAKCAESFKQPRGMKVHHAAIRRVLRRSRNSAGHQQRSLGLIAETFSLAELAVNPLGRRVLVWRRESRRDAGDAHREDQG